jgi:hypothetical protein
MMAGSTPTTTNVLHGQNNFMWKNEKENALIYSRHFSYR